MKLLLFLFTGLILLLSCNSAGDYSKAAAASTSIEEGSTPVPQTERQVLIAQLKRLETIFASGDPEKIATVFTFPLPETAVGIYIEDSSFYAQLEKNGGSTSKAMFIQYFKPISESLQFEEVKTLFDRLHIDRLLQQDTLETEAVVATQPCTRFYGVTVEGKQVILKVGSNSNKAFKSKRLSEDEVPENSSEFCEQVLWWSFRFDGQKLHLDKIYGAG